MRTAAQWLDDATWCVRTSPHTGNFTSYGIEAIQADAATSLALRDQFAAAALTGLLASIADEASRETIEHLSKERSITPVTFVTDLAYTCADAMLARRAQPTAPSTAQTAPSA